MCLHLITITLTNGDRQNMRFIVIVQIFLNGKWKTIMDLYPGTYGDL